MTLLLDTGEPAKVGDRVWRVANGYASITRTTVQPHWSMWATALAGRLFTTEAAALKLAHAECKQRLAKARKESKREARAIERLEERMKKAGEERAA